ncbi:MAG: M14 family metallopeptidase [Planctomycetota bacterium]|nr:M14 family metallopeptidase [Planctomycetota bacterium]MDA1163789.1 M14 family metallopeptidase [Planctomycetota bacterium]
MELARRVFRGPTDGPGLLITGAVHGDEFESMVAIRRLIDLFESEAGSTSLLNGCVTLVPVVNEAAFLRGHRCAEDGLDLARVCPGRADGSITERTARALSDLIESADYYIDMHTGGTEFAVLPLAGYSMHEDSNILDAQRRMAKAFNLPTVWGTAGNLDGRSLSVARDASVPAIYTEYLGSATCHEAGVVAYVEGCLNVMAELKMLDRTPSENRVERTVEDPRPGSGHMQVFNPAPLTGYFEPAVALGDRVQVGDPLGTVFNLTGSDRQTMLAQRAGIVLVLRTFPRVHEGESVGVIMESPS